MQALLLKALDVAISDLLENEVKLLFEGVIEEMSGKSTAPPQGEALQRFRSGLDRMIVTRSEATLAIMEKVTSGE